MLTLQPTELYAWVSTSVTIFNKKKSWPSNLAGLLGEFKVNLVMGSVHQILVRFIHIFWWQPTHGEEYVEDYEENGDSQRA